MTESAGNVEIPFAHDKFKQQKVPAQKPFLTPSLAAVIYAVFALISLVIGIIIQVSNDNVFEQDINYNCGANTSECDVKFKIQKEISGNILLYYQLKDFYQNHKAYAHSKSWNMLKGKDFSSDFKKTKCQPKAVGPTNIPCGSLPMTVFNDTFTVTSKNMTLSDKDITFKTYKKVFAHSKNVSNSEYNYWLRDQYAEMFPGEQENEHFINWIQVAPLKTFRKLFGFISHGSGKFAKDTEIIIHIKENYPIHEAGFKKYLVIAQTNFLGGKNKFFGTFFIVLASFSLVAAAIFEILYLTKSLPLYRCLKVSNERSEIGATII